MANSIDLIIDYDTDVYTEDGELLARFRKNALPNKNIKLFYDNVIDFAKTKTYNRGELLGIKKGKRGNFSNKKEGVRTNIIGYMDGFSASPNTNIIRIERPKKITKEDPIHKDISVK